MNALNTLFEYNLLCGYMNRNVVLNELTNYHVLLLFTVDSSGYVYEMRVPLEFVMEREYEMERRGKRSDSYIMRQINQWNKSIFVPHLASCSALNDIVIKIDIKADWNYGHIANDRLISILKAFYFTGILDIPKDLNGSEILFLKYIIEKLDILLDRKCMRYESFSETLSWSMWTTYLLYRDGIAKWILKRLVKAVKRNKNIVAFVTSREVGKVRYFVDKLECLAIDVIGNHTELDSIASKRGEQ